MNAILPDHLILETYRDGVFPMAESAEDDRFAFYKPYQRGLIPIAELHIPKRLLKTIRQKPFAITFDTAFEAIIDGCAATTPKRAKTWINKPIRDIFIMMHALGHAHSIECRDSTGKIAGGLYGLSIGAVFCGESMVSFQKDASKIALVHLCALLWKSGFTVLDTQFINPHLLQFGAYEMPQENYESLIHVEMEKKVTLKETLSLGFDVILEEYLTARGL